MSVTHRWHIPDPTIGLTPLTPAEREAEIERLSADVSRRSVVQRTEDLVQREYGRDKYGGVLALAPITAAMASELLLRNCGLDPGARRSMSVGGNLYWTTFNDAMRRHDAILDAVLAEAITEFQPEQICELGCGFGAHVARLGPRAYGGELTENGVRLGQQLGLDICAFDFSRADTFRMIRPRSLIFTCAAVEQLPSASALLDGLRTQRDQVVAVLHLEPTLLPSRDHDRLGRLQNEYIRRCDYNRDLNSLLQEQSDVELIAIQPDVIGMNPLNPASLFVWRFAA